MTCSNVKKNNDSSPIVAIEPKLESPNSKSKRGGISIMISIGERMKEFRCFFC